MSYQWLIFALMTVVCWGVYGILLHKGQVLMADPANGRYKAFLFVGVAYFVVAILAPLVLLKSSGASWKFTAGGINWSFWAGVAGAVGAFATLLALGAAFKSQAPNPPALVMSIVFSGAPVVNALVSVWLDRQAGKTYHLPAPFLLGMVLAATGGFLVVKYKPSAPPPPAPSGQAATSPAVAPGYVDVTTRTYHIT